MSTILEHTYFSIGLAEIPALLALIAVIVVFVVKNHKAKKELKELEEQTTMKFVDEATSSADSII